MLGTRPDIDKIPSGGPKSYQFAQKLTGRFFVSGVSGSFKKFEHEQTGKLTKKRRDVLLNGSLAGATLGTEDVLVPSKFERKIDAEYNKELQRMKEIERQLEEIKLQKDKKKQREDARLRSRAVFQATVTLQRWARAVIRRKRTRAVNILVAVLRCGLNKQAVTAASWAAAVIRRFAARVCMFPVLSCTLFLV